MLGTLGANECPSGSVSFEDGTACGVAVGENYNTFSTVYDLADHPKGCFTLDGNNALFNAHTTGAPQSYRDTYLSPW